MGFVLSGTPPFGGGAGFVKANTELITKPFGAAVKEFAQQHGALQYNDGTNDIYIPLVFGRYGTASLRWKAADSRYLGSRGYVTIACMTDTGNKQFDQSEPSNPDSNRRTYGSNRWSASNMRQWLNSDAAGNNWFSAQSGYDAAPEYSGSSGFLCGFTDAEKTLIVPKESKLSLAAADGGGTETVNDKVWLASLYETGLTTSVTEMYPDGERPFEIFADNASRRWNSGYWYLRSANANNSYHVYRVSSTGALSTNGAARAAHGMRPFVNFDASTLVRWSEELKAYEIEEGR